MTKIKLLTYFEIAERLSIKKNTLYSMVHREQIPFIRLSERIVRFDPEQIERWLESNSYTKSTTHQEGDPS